MKAFLIPLISLSLIACEGQDTQVKPQEQAVRSVKFITTKYESHRQVREFSGLVKSAQTSPISFKVGGTVNQVLVLKGQRVNKGQILAQLGTEEFTLALNKAKASLGAANASRIQAEDKFTRAAKLNESGFISDSELTAIRADFDAKLEQQNLAMSDLNNAELNLARTVLYAPYTGLISDVLVDDFTKVNSGQKIIELVNNDSFDIDFLVPESLIQEVQYGEEVDITFPSLPEEALVGNVSEIGAVVRKGNAYTVTVRVNGDTSRLRNGMSAIIRLNVGTHNENIVRLPLEAFDFDDKSHGDENNNAAIFVVNPDTHHLERRYVKLLRKINHQVVVLDNLEEGELVVVAGVPYLYEGQKVNLWQGY
ncbi:efflux RND transporter periplasmic adaptor subunit [Vibrio maerlii]|uniref:efflux RND transporter periplasmic adaptor subunit n=1 Tax=Vibrio maerlii TaxID=2231648 RepID=UPI0013E00934|nr:efflux RND transporter periplasmic adaptor subunit [Vibrio maerlii]